MKGSCFCVVALIALFSTSRASAQVGFTQYTLRASGNGSFTAHGTLTANISGTNGVDPFDPANGLEPLIYDLGEPGYFTAGDLVLNDPGTGDFTDLLRFEQNGTVAIYSDRNYPNSLADVGLPTTFQSNIFSATEELNDQGLISFVYQPTLLSEPGFSTQQTNTYTYESLVGTTLVPEPASLGLLFLSAIGLMAARPGRCPMRR